MRELLFLMIGLLAGGFFGITIMCCLQINRINELSKQE